MTDDALLRRFSAFIDLTDEEMDSLDGLHGTASSLAPGGSIRAEGDDPAGLFFLHEGWAIGSIRLADRSRQVLKLHRPGDIMGAPSLPFETAVENLVALTACKVSIIPLGRLGALFAERPRLGAVLFLTAQEERVTLMDRLVALGRLDAKRSLASLLLLAHRGAASQEGGTVVHLPLTQHQIGDVLGLSSIHVYRTLNVLEQEGFITRDGHTYDLLDVERLEVLVGLPLRRRRRNPSWLPPPAR